MKKIEIYKNDYVVWSFDTSRCIGIIINKVVENVGVFSLLKKDIFIITPVCTLTQDALYSIKQFFKKKYASPLVINILV